MSGFGLSRYIREVGEWSVANFGDQEYSGQGFKLRALYEAAPLFGVVEEIGELFVAFRHGDTLLANSETVDADIVDSIGDVGIYLCDFLYRDGCTDFPDSLPTDKNETLVEIVGELCRAYLKHHQGIRDLADPVVYQKKRGEAVGRLRYSLNIIAVWNTQETFESCVAKTWDSIVSKRDWVADPSKGGGHSHG